jgi:DNA-nicking Smr family endonuclease
MTTPRGLSPEDAAAWRRVTATVEPLKGKDRAQGKAPPPAETSREAQPAASAVVQPSPAPLAEQRPERSGEPRSLTRHGLDGSWERRLANARVAPDLTIDLHGLNLDQAHGRVLAELARAWATGARIVLVIAGKPRLRQPHDPHDRGRGAIRATLLDWLAASEYAPRIAAVRPAHPRHGGAGALYVILRRSRSAGAG